ncbi:MAG: hypothetical protein Kow0025_13090 [Thermodesulfovibrionales bacterium]
MKRKLAQAAAALALFAVLLAGCASPPPASEAKLTKEGTEAILNSIVPDAKVISVEPSQVKGLYEAVVESGGQKGLIYVEPSGKYVVLGSIIEVASKENLTKKKFDELQKVDVSLIPLEKAIVMGKKEAPQKVVVFDDPD